MKRRIPSDDPRDWENTPNIDFHFNVYHTLRRGVVISSTNYSGEEGNERLEDEEREYNNSCYTPLELLDKFRRYLEGESIMEYERKRLIENCRGWIEDEFYMDTL